MNGLRKDGDESVKRVRPIIEDERLQRKILLCIRSYEKSKVQPISSFSFDNIHQGMEHYNGLCSGYMLQHLKQKTHQI